MLAGATALAGLAVTTAAPASADDAYGPSTATQVGAPDHGKKHKKHTKHHKKNRTIDLQLLSFNDFHGHLEASDSAQSPLPPSCEEEGADPENCTPPVGGVEYLARHVAELRHHQPASTLTVAAGDLIGGSTFLSGLFQDQPSVQAMNRLGLDVSSVGNHEFDEGTEELLRMVRGGCQDSGCFQDLKGHDVKYPGADFDYLAANVVRKKNDRPLLPATSVKRVRGVKVGFIGMTLQATPTLVSPAGVSSVKFLDEVKTANRKARDLRQRGVRTIIVLLHEGGYQSAGIDGCAGISGPVVDIANNLMPDIDMLVTGHTHQPYVCNIPDPKGRDRLVTSAASYGQVLTESHLTIKRRTGQVVRAKSTADNHLVTRDVKPVRSETRLINFWKKLAEPLAARVVGTLAPGTDITGHSDTCRCEETPMVDLLADAILWGTDGADEGGAQLAFMNTGGVRASLLYDQISNGEDPGEITYAEAYAVAPFNNLLVSMDLTGAQLEEILNQQYQATEARGSRPMLSLGVSDGFTYEWAWEGDTPAAGEQPGAGTTGGHVVEGSMKLNGEPIVADQTYRVATLNFLADGGDSFTAFTQGSNRLGGAEDLANLVDFFGATSPLTPPGDRVSGL
ncbi:MAG TPA: 5'-nucleotidase C-terminal domain-containing protein [Nocardioidaceae bacterium]|nr:5'-nucleotidase C-terminal domain-containing protein [Nocardioidaceae bacterium]